MGFMDSRPWNAPLPVFCRLIGKFQSRFFSTALKSCLLFETPFTLRTRLWCCSQRQLSSLNKAFNVGVQSDSKPYGYKETKYLTLYLAGLTVLSLCFSCFVLFFRDWVLWDWFKLCWQPVFVATHNSLLYPMTCCYSSVMDYSRLNASLKTHTHSPFELLTNFCEAG